MLASLGMFVFETATTLYSEFDRERSWRQPRTEVFGALPSAQYCGPGSDTIRIGFTLVPEICGSFSAIETLAAMADAGDAYAFVRGDGTVLGQFTIERLSEKHSNLIDTGQARQIDGTLELSRVADA